MTTIILFKNAAVQLPLRPRSYFNGSADGYLNLSTATSLAQGGHSGCKSGEDAWRNKLAKSIAEEYPPAIFDNDSKTHIESNQCFFIGAIAVSLNFAARDARSWRGRGTIVRCLYADALPHMPRSSVPSQTGMAVYI